jgi:hypothetical protein
MLLNTGNVSDHLFRQSKKAGNVPTPPFRMMRNSGNSVIFLSDNRKMSQLEFSVIPLNAECRKTIFRGCRTMRNACSCRFRDFSIVGRENFEDLGIPHYAESMPHVISGIF